MNCFQIAIADCVHACPATGWMMTFGDSGWSLNHECGHTAHRVREQPSGFFPSTLGHQCPGNNPVDIDDRANGRDGPISVKQRVIAEKQGQKACAGTQCISSPSLPCPTTRPCHFMSDCLNSNPGPCDIVRSPGSDGGDGSRPAPVRGTRLRRPVPRTAARFVPLFSRCTCVI